MSEKCKAKYKNLNLIQSMSEQRYVTLQWAEQNCQNDEWLRQQVEKLSYLSPPAVRKRFSPVLVDDSKSYGYMVSGENIIFSNSLNEVVEIDFSDDDLIDWNKTDCHIENYEGDDKQVHSRAVVRSVTTTSVDYSTKHKPNNAANSFWYVGFDKNKPYFVSSAWVKNWKHPNIPSVVRAQTFKCIKGGLLESITLNLQNTGEMTHSWTSPLIVQIWPTTSKKVEKTTWDAKKKKAKSYTPKQYENIAWPKQSIDKPLAQGTFNPGKTTPGWFSIVFNTPCRLKAGTKYAIVIFSPLSHPDHCPRIGGWGRNCNAVKYDAGDAFLSENNGRTFIRYGRNDENQSIDYKFGKLTPQDFAFECKITDESTDFITGVENYLYLKPILTNPINSFHLAGEVRGETNGDSSADGVYLDFEYSVNGRDWYGIRMGEEKYLDGSNVLFVRAVLSTDSKSKTPNIEHLNVYLNTGLPKQMYVRTQFHSPKLSPMLGANIWGRVYAPFELLPDNESIRGSVEIIREDVKTETFIINTVSDLDSHVDLVDDEGEPVLDRDEIINVDDDKRAKYLIDNPSVISALKKHNIYIKPYTLEDVEYLLSFDGGVDADGEPVLGGLKFTNSPAYPIISCSMNPDGNTGVEMYGEWYDYNVDYDTDILTLDKDVLMDMSTGGLAVEYNPVFIQDLSNLEVGSRVDEETGLIEEGLVLDYFKQEFIISESNVETRRVGLRATPVDPVREVILNKDTDNERELYEDVDFTVDYVNKELVFPIVNDLSESSILKVNDTLSVVYTPNLDDTSIALGYWVNREDTTQKCIIKPNYIEYKV